MIKGFQPHPWEENRSLSHSYGYNWEESFDDRFVLSEGDSLDLLCASSPMVGICC